MLIPLYSYLLSNFNALFLQIFKYFTTKLEKKGTYIIGTINKQRSYYFYDIGKFSELPIS